MNIDKMQQTDLRIYSELSTFKKDSELHEFISQNGSCYEHTIENIVARFSSIPQGNVYIVYHTAHKYCLVFEKDESKNAFASLFNSVPIIYSEELSYSDLTEVLEWLIIKFSLDYIYFPQIYATSKFFNEEIANTKFLSWSRPSNMAIIPNQETLFERMQERGFSSSDVKKIKNWTKKRFTFTDKSKNPLSTIKDLLSEIEKSSWKYQYGQSMLQRGNQIEYYANLIAEGGARLLVTYSGEDLVAYCIYTVFKDTAAPLKWSYNLKYRNLSPGIMTNVYLLQKLLDRKDIKFLDLTGSNDNFKNLIKNHEIERFDLAYPDNELTRELRDKRIAFDKKNNLNFKKGNGIRKAYTKKDLPK